MDIYRFMDIHDAAKHVCLQIRATYGLCLQLIQITLFWCGARLDISLWPRTLLNVKFGRLGRMLKGQCFPIFEIITSQERQGAF